MYSSKGVRESGEMSERGNVFRGINLIRTKAKGIVAKECLEGSAHRSSTETGGLGKERFSMKGLLLQPKETTEGGRLSLREEGAILLQDQRKKNCSLLLKRKTLK